MPQVEITVTKVATKDEMITQVVVGEETVWLDGFMSAVHFFTQQPPKDITITLKY